MKLIDAVEEVLKNEQRLGDPNFNYDRAALNEFFNFVPSEPIIFADNTKNTDVVEETTADQEVHYTPPPIVEKKLDLITPKFDAEPREIKQEESSTAESFSKDDTEVEQQRSVSLIDLNFNDLKMSFTLKKVR